MTCYYVGVIDRDTCVCSNHRGSSTITTSTPRELCISLRVCQSPSLACPQIHWTLTRNVRLVMLAPCLINSCFVCFGLEPFSRKSYLFTWLKWQIFFNRHHLLSSLGWTTVVIFHFVFSEPSSASAERIF